jgi:anti-sigma factor RsiW
MKCHDIRELMPEFLAGQLSVDASDQLDAHLAKCADCRGELEQVESMWTALGDLPVGEPGPGLRSRFYAMLEEEKRRLAQAERTSWTKRLEGWVESWWPRRPAFQMATAAVLLVVGVIAGSNLKSSPAPNGEIAHLRGEVQEMQQMVSLSLLKQDSSSERLRGVNWSTRVANPSDALLGSLTSTLQSDPNVNVRLAAVDALALFRDEPGVVDAATDALARESSPMVQIALIDLMTVIQERKALEALRAFIETQNVDPTVKEHAENRISDFM